MKKNSYFTSLLQWQWLPILSIPPRCYLFFKTDARRRSNAHPGNQKKVKRKKKQVQAIGREDQLKFGLVLCCLDDEPSISQRFCSISIIDRGARRQLCFLWQLMRAIRSSAKFSREWYTNSAWTPSDAIVKHSIQKLNLGICTYRNRVKNNRIFFLK